jgi:hypothetical protein
VVVVTRGGGGKYHELIVLRKVFVCLPKVKIFSSKLVLFRDWLENIFHTFVSHWKNEGKYSPTKYFLNLEYFLQNKHIFNNTRCIGREMLRNKEICRGYWWIGQARKNPNHGNTKPASKQSECEITLCSWIGTKLGWRFALITETLNPLQPNMNRTKKNSETFPNSTQR